MKTTLILDSSQIACFLECPEQWHNQYVKRLVPILAQPRDAMNAGTYGHKLLDIYYKARVRGLNLNAASELAFAYDPDKDTCECGCLAATHKPIEALKVQECQNCKKCFYFRPKPFDLALETRTQVQNRLREYFFNYQNNDFIPNNEDAVEVGFSEPIFEDKENLFVLEGRIDLIGTLQGLKCIADHKFQLRTHNLYNKSIQFRNYALVAKSLTLIINYIRLGKGVTKDTLVREPVCFTIVELFRWKEKLIKVFFKIKETLQIANGKQLDQNWSACSGKYNYTCPYTSLCEEYGDDMRKIKERQLYKINPIQWRPW